MWYNETFKLRIIWKYKEQVQQTYHEHEGIFYKVDRNIIHLLGNCILYSFHSFKIFFKSIYIKSLSRHTEFSCKNMKEWTEDVKCGH